VGQLRYSMFEHAGTLHGCCDGKIMEHLLIPFSSASPHQPRRENVR
jgi:hypothetical protein